MSDMKQNGLAFAGTMVAVMIGAAVVSEAIQPGKPGAVQADRVAAAKEAGGVPVSGVAAAGATLDALLAGQKAVALSSLTEAPWRLACVSRNAQPVPEAMRRAAPGCWPDAGMTGLGGSFLSVLDEAGQCHHWRTVRAVIDKRFDDALCIGREEVPTLSISLKGEVLDIE